MATAIRMCSQLQPIRLEAIVISLDCPEQEDEPEQQTRSWPPT